MATSVILTYIIQEYLMKLEHLQDALDKSRNVRDLQLDYQRKKE